MSNLRVAVIGVGPRGLNHLDAIDGFDDVTLAAVCDPSDEARNAVAAKYVPRRRTPASTRCSTRRLWTPRWSRRRRT